jgi:hypothetical protein
VHLIVVMVLRPWFTTEDESFGQQSSISNDVVDLHRALLLRSSVCCTGCTAVRTLYPVFIDCFNSAAVAPHCCKPIVVACTTTGHRVIEAA